MLTRDQILSIKDLPVEKVEVPEWGGFLFVRGLTAEERDHFESIFIDDEGKQKSKKEALKNIRAKLVVLSACDENGKALFAESDIPALAKKSARALNRIFEAGQRLSGLSKADVEDLSKN